jgi:hypothetical protein
MPASDSRRTWLRHVASGSPITSRLAAAANRDRWRASHSAYSSRRTSAPVLLAENAPLSANSLTGTAKRENSAMSALRQ